MDDSGGQPARCNGMVLREWISNTSSAEASGGYGGAQLC